MLLDMELLKITDESGESITGGSQDWFDDKWQRLSGCGPTTASNIIWYMTKSDEKFSNLCAQNRTKADFVRLMESMFTYITPGVRGVNRSSIFKEGLGKYLGDAGADFNIEVLDVPKVKKNRPDFQTAVDFIFSALQRKMPLAFLNLNNGDEADLDSWHWVTVIGASGQYVRILDRGKIFEMDFEKWLASTTLGGALVYISA